MASNPNAEVTSAWLAAIQQYNLDTKSSLKLDPQSSSKDVLIWVKNQEQSFKSFREKGSRIRECLDPVLNFVDTFADTVGEAASIVSDTIRDQFECSENAWILGFPPFESDMHRDHNVAESLYIGLRVHPLAQLLNPCQAAKNQSAHYDAIIELFDRFREFLEVMDIYLKGKPITQIRDLVVKTLAQFLTMMGLVTRQVKDGRVRKS
jgi:hypothetical protein